ncbi:MAG: ABC transporter permease [Clostridia bacterium]|nr:ABC transporter permease [Clostridia bacterium]
MLKFALKNMAIKKVQVILIVLSIVISAGIGVLAFNVSNQVSDGITENAGYYSAIIGPSGSETQLAMNTMYFAEEPLGTIPYSVVSQLQMDQRVRTVIPFAMADSYNGYNVVGTSSELLIEKELKEGQMLDDNSSLQAVIGYNVAKYNDLKVGDVIYTSHSANSAETHTQGITIRGILRETHSSYDNVVFTQIRTLWQMHEHAEEGHEGHSHATVCAILVKTKNDAYAGQIVSEYDDKIVTDEHNETHTLQAIVPMNAVRGVLNDANNTKYIVYVLCAIILIMNIMVISIITLLNMYHSSKEISLMRLIGISMGKINLLYIIQNSIIGLASTVLAFGVSRLCLIFMSDFVSNYGVVLNMGKVYIFELIILLGVFIISVLPTAIWTLAVSKKDSIAD